MTLSRRDFVSGVALGAVGAVARGAVAAPPIESKRPATVSRIWSAHTLR